MEAAGFRLTSITYDGKKTWGRGMCLKEGGIYSAIWVGKETCSTLTGEGLSLDFKGLFFAAGWWTGGTEEMQPQKKGGGGFRETTDPEEGGKGTFFPQ